MDRREFLKTLALTGAAVTMKWDGVMDIMAQNTSQAGVMRFGRRNGW